VGRVVLGDRNRHRQLDCVRAPACPARHFPAATFNYWSVQKQMFRNKMSPQVQLNRKWLDACMCVCACRVLLCRPFVGRLSDLYGRLPFYYCGLTINICSALYVAWVGADMTSTAIVIFSVLRGFSQATVRRCMGFVNLIIARATFS
jgi:hypothetical protein